MKHYNVYVGDNDSKHLAARVFTRAAALDEIACWGRYGYAVNIVVIDEEDARQPSKCIGGIDKE